MVANFRLKKGHDCLAARVRKIGIYESSECTIRQIPNSNMDEEHLLCCSKLDTDQQVLKNTIKLYWDARAKITSPPSDIGMTTTDLSCSVQHIYHWSTKFNFFLAHEEKYLILIELLTLNSNA